MRHIWSARQEKNEPGTQSDIITMIMVIIRMIPTDTMITPIIRFHISSLRGIHLIPWRMNVAIQASENRALDRVVPRDDGSHISDIDLLVFTFYFPCHPLISSSSTHPTLRTRDSLRTQISDIARPIVSVLMSWRYLCIYKTGYSQSSCSMDICRSSLLRVCRSLASYWSDGKLKTFSNSMSHSSMSISEPIYRLVVAMPHSSDSSRSKMPSTNIAKMAKRRILVILWCRFANIANISYIKNICYL